MFIFSDDCRQSLSLEPVRAGDYPSSAVECARFFLGCILLKARGRPGKPGRPDEPGSKAGGLGEVSAGLIIEAEAYSSDDPASHSWRGQTERNQAMFSGAGTVYVYRSYGIHHCANIVVSPGNAVLIRALFPLAGIKKMIRRRNGQVHRRLCCGPGNVCAAMDINISHNFYPLNLTGHGEEFLGLFKPAAGESTQKFTDGQLKTVYAIKQSGRIGISKNVEVPWRVFMDVPGYISHSRAGHIVC